MVDRKKFNSNYLCMQKVLNTNWFREYQDTIEQCYAIASKNRQSTLLDVGCYSGVFHLVYEKYFSKIVLSDIVDQRATAVIDRFPFYKFSLDSSFLPSAIQQFDFVNCLEVIEHVFDEFQAMSNLYKLTKPGGYLLLTTPNRLRIAERIKGFLEFPTKFPTKEKNDYAHVHYREYSVNEIINLLQQFHFRIEKVKLVIAGIGPFYFHFWRGFPDKLKRHILILAQKEGKKC